MKKLRIFLETTAIVLCMALLAACTPAVAKNTSSTSGTSTAKVSGTTIQNTTDANAAVVEYEDDDYYFDWKNATHTTITLNGGSAAVSGQGAKASGSVVTILSSGTYEITGTLTDGSIVVDIDKSVDKGTVFIILNGVDITSQTSAPIYIKDAKKIVLLLETGTKNTVYGGSGCVVNADNEPSAAIFSKADLTISGSGTLTVKSDFNDGITSKDVLKITDGTLTVNSKSDGIVGKDSINIEKATITISAGKDGMKSSNETDATLGNVMIKNGQFTITAECDAVSAVNTLQIDNGTFNLTSGGGYPGKSISSGNDPGGNPGGNFGGKPGEKMAVTAAATTNAEISKKGLKAGKNLIVNGGNITISSYDDAIHSNLNLTINNATLTIQTGDDGIHAEKDAVINSGPITIKNSYEGIEGSNVTLNSGTFSISSTDDGININSSSGVFTINGGEISVNANGDGLDSNGTIIVTGGSIYVDGPINDGNGAIDYDSDFQISGGNLIASGSSGMAQAPSEESKQFSLLMYYDSIQTAGTKITVKDGSGNVVASFTPTKKYSSVAISSPLLASGSTYTLYKNDTKVTSFKISDALTYLTESGVTTGSQFKGPMGRK